MMIASALDTLFSEVQLAGLTLKNRIAMAPLTRTSASAEGLATREMVDYYARLARAGFGLIFTEGVYPDLAYSQGYHYQPGIACDEQMLAWRPVVEAVHRHGGRLVLQLLHAGALTQGNPHAGETVAPSAVRPRGGQIARYGGEGLFPLPRPLAPEEIDQLVADFAAAAARAQQVGFDGVEVHGGTGYLLDQFLTHYTNRRCDRWGGSRENRVRLACEVLRAIRARVGEAYPVGIRISQAKINDGAHRWPGGEDDAAAIFRALGRERPHFIHVLEPDASAPAFDGSPPLAALAKRHAGVSVIAHGRLGAPEKVKALLGSGAADLISLGRAALASGARSQAAAQGDALMGERL